MIAAIRVRGLVNRPQDVAETLQRLRLRRKNVCVLLQEKPEMLGMLRKAKDVITWGEIDKATLQELVAKRGRLTGNKHIPNDKISEIAEKITNSNGTLIDSSDKKLGIKPYFRLNPPRKGFERKGIKKSFKQGGALGYRGKEINKLIMRML